MPEACQYPIRQSYVRQITIAERVFDKTYAMADRLVPSYELNWSALNYEPDSQKPYEANHPIGQTCIWSVRSVSITGDS